MTIPDPVGTASLRRVEGVARVVAVASGKGGVGKSTIAVNLALALRAKGHRVALLDADVYGPNVPLLLGVRRRENVDVNRALLSLGATEGARERLQPLARHGLSVLSLALLVGEDQDILPDNAALAGMVIRHLLLDTQWGNQDYLILDLPPGTGEPQTTMVSQVAVDGVILVTTPHNTALLDTLRSLRMFHDAGVPVIGRVENMSYLLCPHCGEPIVLPVPDDFSDGAIGELPLLGRLPFDVAISLATNTGRPIVLVDSEAPASAVFSTIADGLDAYFGNATEIL